MLTENLTKDIYRALRDGRSQLAVSRWLGFKSNVLYTWESGRRQPKATTIFRWVQRKGLALEPGLRRFFKVDVPEISSLDLSRSDHLVQLLAHLCKRRSITEIAEHSGFSRFQISRWRKGLTEPTFDDLLALIEALTSRMLDFVSILVDPGQLPSVAEQWTTLEASRSLFWRKPEAQLIVLALELTDYLALPQHDDHWLAKKLDLPLYSVTSSIEQLLITGQILFDGHHYRHAQIRTVDTRQNPAAGQDLRRWWWAEAGDRVNHPESSVSFNAFTCSQDDYIRIIEIYRAAFRQMRSIVAHSAEDERYALLTQGLVPLDRPKE